MDKYLLPEDDGLPARPSGKWVKEKLFYVKKYIDVFEIAMRNKSWRRRIYIDLFSGPGKCKIRRSEDYILGSPLLAIQTQHPFTDYFFVDLKQNNIDALQERCKASPISKEALHFLVGDANIKVDEIAQQISDIDAKFITGLLPCLNLAFLDPEGLELDWTTVETLARMKRMDLIIHYSQFGLTRNFETFYNSPNENRADRFFGSKEWRKIYADSLERGEIAIHRSLMDFYKSRLRELGYVVIKDNVEDVNQNVREPLIRHSTKNAPLYRLLFASKHPLGNKLWEEVTKKDIYGQQSFW
jgi:three-Cys-motif partner protein